MPTLSTFTHGYVVGRFVSAVGDSVDADRYPDITGAPVSITFTRLPGQYVQPLSAPEQGVKAVMVSHEPIKATVMADGTLTGDLDPNGKPAANAKSGIWLVTGQYRVDLGGFFPSLTIDVKVTHTEASPLDLSSAVGYSPTPSDVVYTLSLPAGGEPGQVYGWNGSNIGWYTPAPGPPGPPGTVVNASSHIISGPGRPDLPATTNGAIKGTEPVGAEYRSTDGANVGADVWRKRPDNAWVVLYGDTGWRDIQYMFDPWPRNDYDIAIRRINNTIFVSAAVITAPDRGYSNYTELPKGLRGPRWSKYVPLMNDRLPDFKTVGVIEVSYGIQFTVNNSGLRGYAVYSYVSEDVWLDSLPGEATSA